MKSKFKEENPDKKKRRKTLQAETIQLKEKEAKIRQTMVSERKSHTEAREAERKQHRETLEAERKRHKETLEAERHAHRIEQTSLSGRLKNSQ